MSRTISAEISSNGTTPEAFNWRKKFRQSELLALLLLREGILADQAVEFEFAGDVAGAVARLTQVQELLEGHEIALRVGPAARRPQRVKLARFLETHLVRLHIERGESARGSVRQHRPHDFAAARALVIQPCMHQQFFHRGGETL